jgi:hypothetical protein
LTLIGDLLVLLRKYRIKAALAALAHSRLNKSVLSYVSGITASIQILGFSGVLPRSNSLRATDRPLTTDYAH